MKLAELAKELNENPTEVKNLGDFGKLLLERNEFSSALIVFKFLYRIESSVTNLMMLCKTLINTNIIDNIKIAVSLINTELNNLKNSQADLFELRKLIGNAYTHIGDFNSAKMYYESCIKMNREQDVVYTNLGILYYTEKMYVEARECFEKAIEYKADNSNALAGLGMTLSEMDHPGLAMVRLHQALDYEPTNISAINTLINLAHKTGNLNMVINRLKDYLECDPMNVNMIYSYAALEYQLGNIEIAKSEIEKALLINPEHTYANELMDIIFNDSVSNVANKEVDSTI